MSGQTVASLQAVIGADTSGFERGAAKVKSELGGMGSGLNSVTKGLAGFVANNVDAIAALTTVAEAAKKSYMAFQDYAGEVRDLSLITGTGAESTSRFIQVLDDYQLTTADAETATKRLKEKGLVPTIDTLGKLATQYQAINDPAAKMAFIQDNLGKGGVKWVNILQQSASALDAQSAAVSKNLILTDDQIKKSEEARLAIDAWNDSIHGIQISIGAWIGNMIAVNAETEKTVANYRELTGDTGLLTNAHGQLNKSVEAYAGQMARGAAETEFYNNQLKNTVVSADEAAAAQKALADADNNFMSVLGNVSSEMDNYNQKTSDLNAQLDKLTKEQAATPTWSANYKKLGTQIDDTKKSISQLASEQHKASQKIIFDLIAQRAAADGYKTITLDSLLQIGEQMGVVDKDSVDMANSLIQQAGAIGDGLAYPKSQLTDMNSKVKNLQLLALQGINIDATVTIHTIGSLPGGGAVTYDNHGDVNKGPPKPGQNLWAGGQLGSGWTLVGDMPGGIPTPWSELISPSGHVFNARQTKELLRNGMVGVGSLYDGSDGPGSSSSGSPGSGGGSSSPIANSPVAHSHAGRTGSGGSGGGSMNVSASVVQTAAASASQTQQQAAQQIQMQVSAQQASQTILNDKLEAMIAVLTNENPRAIGKQVAYQLAQNS